MTALGGRLRCLFVLPALWPWIGCAQAGSKPAPVARGEASSAESEPALGAAARSEPSAQAAHCAQHEPLAATAPLPGRSVYHLQATLLDQRGTELHLDAFRGQPVLITMFYASCTSICPMLIGQLKRIESTLAPEVRAQTRVLLVSLDPERDSVERLAALAREHAIDSDRWHFTRTSESSVREIAAVLGVRYRRMPDGQISHSPLVALLDREGSVVVRVEGALSELNVVTDPLARMVPGAHAGRVAGR